MKKVIFYTFFLVVFCFNTEGYSQLKFNYEVNGGYIINNLNTGTLLNNWDRGWLIGAKVLYNVTPGVKVSVNISYQNYSFTGGYYFINFPDDESFARNIRGEKTHLYELSLATRFVSTKSAVRFFFSLRGGLALVDIGKIVFESWDDDDYDSRRFSLHPGTGRLVADGLAAFGFGVIFSVRSDLKIVLESGFSGTFKTNGYFMPVTLAVQF